MAAYTTKTAGIEAGQVRSDGETTIRVTSKSARRDWWTVDILASPSGPAANQLWGGAYVKMLKLAKGA